MDSASPPVSSEQGVPGSEDPSSPEATADQRTKLNLLGQTDTQSGESRRNENIQFNLVDNNALQELNTRLGTTATIVDVFLPSKNYFGAEFGNSPASAIHLSTSQASGIHGRIFGTHGNSIFSSRSFFQVGDVKPAHENSYGFDFRSPLWSGASISLQGNQQKIRGMVNGNVLVPLPEERTPLATDPAVRALVGRILGAYPAELPNRTDINRRMLNTNAPQRIDGNTAGVRLDQSAGDRDTFALKYLFVSQKVDAFQFVAGQNPDTTTLSHDARVTWTRQWTPSSVTDFSAGFNRVTSLLVPEENNVGPTFGTSGLSGVGPGPDIPIDRAENVFRYAGQMRQLRGNHNWTVGSGFLRRQFNGVQSDSQFGSFRFANDFGRDGITNLRMGLPQRVFISAGFVPRGFRSTDMYYFFGDKWAATRNLTLSYGLRYEATLAPYEVDALTPIPYNSDLNNLAPQFGFAYRISDTLGVVRGAYGVHYGDIIPVTYQQLRFNPPLNYKFAISGPDLMDPLGVFLGSQSLQDVRYSLYELDQDLVLPYSHQYNFSWEPNLASSWKIQVGYVGSRTHKILQTWYTNRARVVPGTELTTKTVDERRPDRNLSEVKHVANASRAYYDAARVTLIAPRWNGISLDASYWFSKALDLGVGYSNTASTRSQTRSQSEFEGHKDLKGLSDFDQPHSFLARLSYELPSFSGQSGWVQKVFGRWSLSTVALLKTGTPFTVESGSDSPGFGNVDGASGDRPNLLDPSVLGRTIGDPDTSVALLPKAAFAYIQPGESGGNLGRNTFRKGGIRNVNAALSRSFTVASEKLLVFRAESINLLNTPQFAAPGSGLTDGNFGGITNTLNDGRTFRFRLSFMF